MSSPVSVTSALSAFPFTFRANGTNSLPRAALTFDHSSRLALPPSALSGLGGDLGRVGRSKSLVDLIPVFISGFYIVEILRTVLIQSVVFRFTRHPATLPL